MDLLTLTVVALVIVALVIVALVALAVALWRVWAWAGDDRVASRQQRAVVLDRDGHRCLKCERTELLQMDHVKAWSRGGRTTVRNLQTLCQPCNGSKGRQRIDYRKR